MNGSMRITAVSIAALGLLALPGQAIAAEPGTSPKPTDPSLHLTQTQSRTDASTSTLGIARVTDNNCEVGKFCLYYNSDTRNAYAPYYSRVDNFINYNFTGVGAGNGQGVKNNAASVINAQSGSANVYFNSGGNGPWDTTAAFAWRNLKETYNENASWHTV